MTFMDFVHDWLVCLVVSWGATFVLSVIYCAMRIPKKLWFEPSAFDDAMKDIGVAFDIDDDGEEHIEYPPLWFLTLKIIVFPFGIIDGLINVYRVVEVLRKRTM